MAQDFRRILLSGVGTAAADAPNGSNFGHNNTIIGITMANITDNAIIASAYIANSGTNTYLVRNAPIASGGTLSIDAKVVVQSGDRLYYVSDTASSLDVVTSYVEDIS